MPSPDPEPTVTISQEIVPSPVHARSIAHKTLWSSLNPSTRLADAPTQTPAEALTRKIIFEPPWWVSAWFAGSSVLVIWDFTYCFFRPHSFEHWIWRPYQLYATIDYIYSPRAYESGNGFTNAQSFLNVIETMLNFEYLYLAHTASTKRGTRGHATAPLIGFAAAIMTLSKTLLYHLQEYYCGGCMVGHNDLKTLFWLWIIPNGAWIVVPFFVMCTLGAAIASALRRDAAAAVHEMEGLRAAAASEGVQELLEDEEEPTVNAVDVTPTKPSALTAAPASEIRQLRSRDVSMTPSRSVRGDSVASGIELGSEANGTPRTRQTARRGRSVRAA